MSTLIYPPTLGGLLIPGGAAPSGGGLDASTTAWINAVVAAGGSVSAPRQTVVDTLITGLKSDSLWTKLDRLWIFAAENTQSALIDLKSLASATAVNSPSFTTDQGYTGDGSTAYLNSGFVPSTAGGNYTLNSCSIGAYDRSTTIVPGTTCAIGTYDGSNYAYMATYDNTKYTGEMNGGSFPQSSTIANGQGQFVQTRNGSSSTIDVYKNGSLLFNGSDTSVALPSKALYFLAGNNNGSGIFQASNHQLAAAFIGGALSSTEAGNMSSRINTYMTSVSANVY